MCPATHAPLVHGGHLGIDPRLRWDYKTGSDVCVIEPPQRGNGAQNQWLHSVTAATLTGKPAAPSEYLLVVTTAVKVKKTPLRPPPSRPTRRAAASTWPLFWLCILPLVLMRACL